MFFLCCSQIQSGYKVQKGAQNESNITNVVPIGSVDQWHHSIHCILQADHAAIHTYSKAYVCMHGKCCWAHSVSLAETLWCSSKYGYLLYSCLHLYNCAIYTHEWYTVQLMIGTLVQAAIHKGTEGLSWQYTFCHSYSLCTTGKVHIRMCLCEHISSSLTHTPNITQNDYLNMVTFHC